MSDKEQVSNPDSILFVKIDHMPKGLSKDQLLSKHLTKSIELQTDSIARNKLFNAEIGKVSNIDYKKLSTQNLTKSIGLRRGLYFRILLFLMIKELPKNFQNIKESM